MDAVKQYATEAELCAAFIKHNSELWTAYQETCGFDILMVRKLDGVQVGVEAKLRLNAEVILQAAEPRGHWSADSDGPDYRAVLVPWDKRGGALKDLLPRLQLTGIFFGEETVDWPVPGVCPRQHPNLGTIGDRWNNGEWFELCPAKRCALPDYIPDSIAGTPSPVTLTEWKVKAIKIAVTLEKRGFVTRHDFKFHKIDMSRWTQGRWLLPNQQAKGQWVGGSKLPKFREQHPINYASIEADYEKWQQPELVA